MVKTLFNRGFFVKKLFFILLLILSAQSTHPLTRLSRMSAEGRTEFSYRGDETVKDWRRPFADYYPDHLPSGTALEKLNYLLFSKSTVSQEDEQKAAAMTTAEIKRKVMAEINQLRNEIISIADGRLSGNAKKHVQDQTKKFAETFGDCREAAYKGKATLENCQKAKESFLAQIKEFVDEQSH
jgi:gas vesicle protein